MASLVCKKCLQQKDTADFYTVPATKRGYDSHCKVCREKHKRAYSLTPHGRALQWLRQINERVENRDGKHRTYVNVHFNWEPDAFLAWAEEEIEKFYLHSPGLVPSIDRIDSKGNYEPGNVRVISWNDHRRLKKQAKTDRDQQRLQEYLASLVAKGVPLRNKGAYKPQQQPQAPIHSPLVKPAPKAAWEPTTLPGTIRWT